MSEYSERATIATSSSAGEKLAWVERAVVILLLLGLLIGVLAILKPFTTAILFGAVLATAAWPLRQALVRQGLTRGAAASLLLVLALAGIAIPVLLLAPRLAEQLTVLITRTQTYFALAPEQPAWLANLPLVGSRLAGAWKQLVEHEGNMRSLLAPYAASIESQLVVAAQALADSILQVILSLAVATMFWVNGDALIAFLHSAVKRLGGPVADRALYVAGGRFAA